MRIAGIKPSKITRLFLSHWHGDHVFGVAGLISTLGADKMGRTLPVYGPKGTKQYLRHLLKSFAAKEVIPLEIHEVSAGVIYENEDYVLEVQPLKHSVPCLGFSFKEKDRRKIIVEEAEKRGLNGPILRQLQSGKEVIREGEKVDVDSVTILKKGKKISYIADTLPCKGADVLAKDADLLISEGTHLDEIKEKTENFKHLTVKQAALIASENYAKKLIITHISQRYKSSTEILEEAKTYFPNSVVAEDFMRIKV